MIDEKEIALIEKVAIKVGMTSLLNHGAASCVYSEGCNGVTQDHLVAFAREVALHCVAALSTAAQPPAGFVLVPIELAQRVQETMGEFLMDHGWRQQDMDTSDEFDAALAAAAPASAAKEQA